MSETQGEPVRVHVLEDLTQRENIEADLRARGCEIVPLDSAMSAPDGASVARATPSSVGAAPAALAGDGPDAWAGISYARAREQALRRFEVEYVGAQLRACGGNISAAARRAGMDRSNFKRLLRKYRRATEGEVPIDDDLAIG